MTTRETMSRIQSVPGAALLLGLALTACSPSRAAERQPVPVRVQAVEKRASSGPTRYSGALEPAARVDMAFRVGGYVDLVATANGQRALDKGDVVRKGAVLARVRVADYAQKFAQAQAQVGEARAQASLAEEELERARRLFAADAITRAELDSKIARADSARAQVDGAQARSGEAGLSLSDTVLRAPMDGVVLARHVEVGALLSPGQPVITIADIRTVKAIFGAPQSLVERLQIGSSVQVFVGAESEARSPEKLLDARVTRIAPAADADGRVFSVEAALANEDRSLRPGSVVSVRVPEAVLPDPAVIVPLAAVIRAPRDPRGFEVFVLEGAGTTTRARLRKVQLGEVIGNAVTVTEGLALDQRVVTAGSSLLRDGSDTVVIR
jgi:multidrug efflux system membrane fusion protein